MQHYIYEVRKLLPVQYCKKVLAYFADNLLDAEVGDQKINKNIRNCKTKYLLKDETSFGKTLVLNYVKKEIHQVVSEYKQVFNFLNVTRLSQLDLLQYDANDSDVGYSFHVDSANKASERTLSLSICLNNGFAGAEFEFLVDGKKIVYTQNVGDCLIFPSNFMFPHQVNKVLEGTRYSLVGWLI